MLAGHFGLAAAVKAKEPDVPLWALMLSTQLLDILFVPLLLAGVESIEPVGEGGYGEAVIHAHYTHSLLGAVLISILAGIAAWRIWNRRSGIVIGGLTFSHWLLDLLVHRADMPVLPGNFGQLPLLGFRLWEWPFASILAESLLILAGAILYFRSALVRAGKHPIHRKRRAYVAGTVMAVLLAMSLVTSLLPF